MPGAPIGCCVAVAAYHIIAATLRPASVGIVTSQTGDDDAETSRNADLAMYEAKHAGRACAVFFNDAMHTRLTRNLTIETSLREALGTEQLSLVYQPIVELDTGRRSSVEALIRWKHPTLGAISPGEFVPVAEESGLIVPVGEWVMRESCARWRAGRSWIRTRRRAWSA
jgi:predicted signal transduction protein with EAL and GGDEF domain